MANPANAKAGDQRDRVVRKRQDQERQGSESGPATERQAPAPRVDESSGHRRDDTRHEQADGEAAEDRDLADVEIATDRRPRAPRSDSKGCPRR
jgi:hypothetical protein